MAGDRTPPFSATEFSQRKSDHLQIALDARVQAEGQNGLEQIELIHEALPDLNFSEVDLSASFLTQTLHSPFFISSMTAGHEKGLVINAALARLSSRRRILMGVGSQRRELSDEAAALEWRTVREQAPAALLLGNIGIAQLIQTPLASIQRLVDSVQACALFVHLNPLQECLQPEGTTDFRGGYEALTKLVKFLSVPVIVKEVGCGLSVQTIQRLGDTGVHAIDVSGFGGTHWGRIEGLRSSKDQLLYRASQTFADWGISTVQSMQNAREALVPCEIWASGGVRNGLEAAKLCAMGAKQVGLAKPFLQAILDCAPEADLLKVDQALDAVLDQLEFELRMALFCTGTSRLADLNVKQIWQWRR